MSLVLSARASTVAGSQQDLRAGGLDCSLSICSVKVRNTGRSGKENTGMKPLVALPLVIWWQVEARSPLRNRASSGGQAGSTAPRGRSSMRDNIPPKYRCKQRARFHLKRNCTYLQVGETWKVCFTQERGRFRKTRNAEGSGISPQVWKQARLKEISNFFNPT